MSAAITYEGLPGGQLFKGIKFWVAQRVACRKSLLDSISNNGGSIVPLEKNADMLIADHMRADAPPGAYSWKWVDDSIKKGVLQNKDDGTYLIGHKSQKSRPMASAAPGKSTRTPFTPSDDSDLIKWVLANSKNDKGNTIYQDLERVNNRHTYQSWRDRWNLESATQLEELASYWPQGQWWHSDYPLEEPVQQRTIDSMLRVTKYVLEADDRLDDLWKEDGILSRLARTKGAGLLTRAVADAARQEIKSHYRNQLERADGSPAEPRELPESRADAQMASPLVSPRQGIQAGPKWFQEFAVENPEHTWQSWRNHWLKVLRPRIEAAESKGQKYDFYHAYSKPPFQNQSSSPQENGPSNDKHRGVRQTTTSPERVEDVIEVKDVQTEPPSPELDDERNEFLANIAAYSEVMELAIDLQPKICRQSVDLYLLHVAVEACRDPDGEEDWQQVAEQLGFARDFVNTLEEPDSQSNAEEVALAGNFAP
ncbi:hypothetical protein HYQ44_009600 [Verticillium longisporum]|nr:hypothetical protein HYQ44_009600 [Verticillium longisporum]